MECELAPRICRSRTASILLPELGHRYCCQLNALIANSQVIADGEAVVKRAPPFDVEADGPLPCARLRADFEEHIPVSILSIAYRLPTGIPLDCEWRPDHPGR